MGGIKALRKLQYGLEITPGTAVAATAQWRGTAKLQDARELMAIPEDWGFLLPSYRTTQPMLLAKLSLEGPATYEQLPVLLSAGIENIVSGAADGSGYYYDYDVGVSAVQTLKAYTFRGGDNQRVDVVEYGTVESISLEGKPGKPWMVKAEWFGRQCTDGDFTDAITPQVVEEAHFGKTLFYIDASGGTIGTTAKAGTLLAAKIDIKTGAAPLFTGDGNALYFQTLRQGPPVITGTLTLEHDATGEAELGFARAATAGAAAASCVRLIRIKTQGSAIGGTIYPNKTMQIDLPLVYTAVPQIEDENSDDILNLPFRVVYDTMSPQIIVANALSALV